MPRPERDAGSARPLIEAATTMLREAGIESARVDATILAEHALGLDHLVLAMAPAFSPEQQRRYEQLVERRRAREPLQLITGVSHFRRLRLSTRRGVFIPRPETEVVADYAIEHARTVTGRAALVVDLCCGAGPIGLSVAEEVPGAHVWAMDADPAAVDLTRQNAARAGLRVHVEVGDVRCVAWDHLRSRVDVVVSNPPYIPPGAVPRDPEVREHDPELALYGGGEDGLELPGAVVDAASRLLRPGGLLVMEHAEVQDAAVRALVHDRGGFTGIRTARDLAGRPRMVLAWRSAAGDADPVATA